MFAKPGAPPKCFCMHSLQIDTSFRPKCLEAAATGGELNRFRVSTASSHGKRRNGEISGVLGNNAYMYGSYQLNDKKLLIYTHIITGCRNDNHATGFTALSKAIVTVSPAFELFLSMTPPIRWKIQSITQNSMQENSNVTVRLYVTS